jgi:CspA family cold shock protein
MVVPRGAVVSSEVNHTVGGSIVATGKVKWFDRRKGYGFIVGDDGKDYFVHYTGIEGEGYKLLEKDQQVEFRVETTEKGPKAVRVRVLSERAKGA